MRFFLPLLAVLLSACGGITTVQSVDDPEGVWRTRQASLSTLSLWNLTGRISVMNGEDVWSGTLRWQQTPAIYAIDFIAPLGQGSMRLQGDGDTVLMRTSDNQVYVAATPEALMQRHLGWQVPLSGMRYWALGLPVPDMPARQQLDAQGRLQVLLQSGWEVTYHRYIRIGAQELPEKIFMKHRELDVRMIINHWDLPPSTSPAPAGG